MLLLAFVYCLDDNINQLTDVTWVILLDTKKPLLLLTKHVRSTPFLLVHGDDDRLCNPIGSELLYRSDNGGEKTWTATLISGAVRSQTRVSKSFLEQSINFSWRLRALGVRSSQKLRIGSRGECDTCTLFIFLSFIIFVYNTWYDVFEEDKYNQDKWINLGLILSVRICLRRNKLSPEQSPWWRGSWACGNCIRHPHQAATSHHVSSWHLVTIISILLTFLFLISSISLSLLSLSSSSRASLSLLSSMVSPPGPGPYSWQWSSS